MELLRDEEPAPKAFADFAARLKEYAIKAAREAKLHTSWAAPDAPYEEALTRFIERMLDPNRSAPFLADVRAFVREIAPQAMRNAMAQAVLKLTVPGVPDTYQGCELWDLSLVDPDNRRPVDYALRTTALGELGKAPPHALLESWQDGRIKLHIVARLARLRRAQPALFRDGSYQPLAVAGAHAERICAFARVADGAACVAAVPLGPNWSDTTVGLPEEFAGRDWDDVLTGEIYERPERLDAARLFATFPVAALFTRPPPG
jgi:(1->4)-alpha-D-glucan 1-alpha-D-glucosylmutase